MRSRLLKKKGSHFLVNFFFLETEHFIMKKEYDKLKSEKQQLKEDLSLRKEGNPSSQRLNDLINSWCKYSYKRGFEFIDETLLLIANI